MKFAVFYEIPVNLPNGYGVRLTPSPYNISHEDCMQTIELMGKHVIPEFNG